MATKKPRYVPPTIDRYAPFFSGSPSKIAGLMQGAEKTSDQRRAKELTVPIWDRRFDDKSPERQEP